MNFEQIKSFLSVARTGNFSQAAKERFISQPTISNQMRMLEEELDTKLFLRTSKNTTLTEQGQKFYKYATQLLAIEKDIYISIKEKKRGVYGILDVAAPHLQTDCQLGTFVNRMIAEENISGGGITVRVVEHEDEMIPQLVLSGEIELGICNTVLHNPKLEYQKAFVEEIYLITPNEERFRHLNREQLLRCLVEEPYIRFDFGQGSDYLWNDFFGKTIGVDLHEIRTAARCSNYNMVLDAVKAGYGIAFISSTIMQKEWRAGEILAYRCKALLEKQFYIVYDRERARTSEAIQYVKTVLAEELEKSIEIPNESI